MRRIVLDRKVIDDASDAYVVAEIGHNHQGQVEQAAELIRRAAAAGADAVKFQKRDLDRLFTKAFADRPYDHRNSFGRTYREHRRALELGADEFRALQDVAAGAGVSLLATPFDPASVDFLVELDVPVLKIASADLLPWPGAPRRRPRRGGRPRPNR